MLIYKTELPDLADLFDRTMKIQSMKGTEKKELDELAAFFLTEGKKFVADYELYIKEEIYGNDPGRSTMDLENYDLIGAGFVGLGQGLFHKYRAGVYEQLTVESNGPDNKKKLAMGDRTEYAKGSAAAIEGSLGIIEATKKNIGERLNSLRTKRSRY